MALIGFPTNYKCVNKTKILLSCFRYLYLYYEGDHFMEVNVCIKRWIISYKACWEEGVKIGSLDEEEGKVLLKVPFQLGMLKILVWGNCIFYASYWEEKNSCRERTHSHRTCVKPFATGGGSEPSLLPAGMDWREQSLCPPCVALPPGISSKVMK